MSKSIFLTIILIYILPLESVICQTNLQLEKFTDNPQANEVKGGSIFKIGVDVKLPEGKKVPNIIVIGGDVFIDGKVTQYVIVIFGDVYLDADAQILDGVVTLLGKIDTASEGQILGHRAEITNIVQLLNVFIDLASGMPKSVWGKWSLVGWRISMFAALLLIQLLLVSKLPMNVRNMTDAIPKRFLGISLLGILSTVGMIPIGISLFLSLAGIPLLLILWAFLFLACLYGKVTISLLIGNVILQRRRPNHLAVLVGYGIYRMATFLPYLYLGKIIFFIANVISIGICIRTIFGMKSVIKVNSDEVARDAV
ncbi:MAG: hypothetical protein ACE5PV_01420 [Candidatus Poribacteria bacterium]